MDKASQLGTLLEGSGRPGMVSRAVQYWTGEGGFADDGIMKVTAANIKGMQVPFFSPKPFN